MKKLIFLLSFLLTISVFAEGARDKGQSYSNSAQSQPCDLRNSSFEIINHVKSSIEQNSNFPKSVKNTKYDKNYFPHTGKLIMPLGDFGSGTFVGIRDENGKVSRNKVITSAHLFFNENGELKNNLDVLTFKIGNNINDAGPDSTFKITKIECLGIGHNDGAKVYTDNCIVTMDKDLPPYIDPAIPWDEKFDSIEQAIASANDLYTAGFHGYWPKDEDIRMYNMCDEMNFWNYNNKAISSDCNTSPGMSGGGAFVTIKSKNGKLTDYYIGSNKGPAMGTKYTKIAPYLGTKNIKFDKIVITRQNQYEHRKEPVP